MSFLMVVKRSFYFVAVLAVIFAATGYLLWGKSFLSASAQNVHAEKILIKTADDKSHAFHVELALTPAQQAYGLMNRKSMPKDYGMLFVFQTDAHRSFWMKNTLIPLDMIFIKNDGTIGHIHENAIPHDLTPVLSQGKARAVLEINGGVSSKLGIKPGDKVIHKIFDVGPE